ncbi:MAG: hypothetical protein JNG89_14435 [Planctomycetaceae bacterium]|nr:hypothetical protein [Planctomycetaceae bacterium]
MSANLTEMRDVSHEELQTIEGGWLPSISVRNIRDLMTERGDAPGQQETWIVSLSPSQKP